MSDVNDEGLEDEGEDHSNDSLKASDAAASAVATSPRVSLADIEAEIEEIYYITGDEALESYSGVAPAFSSLTLCLIEMKNGYIIIGKSAPASPENFNPELGKKFAYEDCVRQLWPLMGFALREKLSKN